MIRQRKLRTSFAHEDAMKKLALGLNFIALTLSSGGDATSTSFIGFCRVPKPRLNGILLPMLLVVLPNEDPNILNFDKYYSIFSCWLYREQTRV